jgi:formylglycine-generating enzyme required for sulfatase activity
VVLERPVAAFLTGVLLVLAGSLPAADVSRAAQAALASMEWVLIPAGSFVMGSTPEEAAAAYSEARLRSSMLERATFDAELPRHTVILDAFQISRYEITNGQYRAFIEDTGRPRPRGYEGEDTWADATLNGDDQPVVGVTWFDAQAFAEWLSGSLPTEAQWERAARGTSGRKYPWGDAAPTVEHANFARRQDRATPGGRFPKGATPEGVQDLAGNVWEWCLDEYDETFYARSPARNPVNLLHRDVLRDRVLRGGSWDYGVAFLRSALRLRFYPLNSTHNVGFRVVRPAGAGAGRRRPSGE